MDDFIIIISSHIPWTSSLPKKTADVYHRINGIRVALFKELVILVLYMVDDLVEASEVGLCVGNCILFCDMFLDATINKSLTEIHIQITLVN